MRCTCIAQKSAHGANIQNNNRENSEEKAAQIYIIAAIISYFFRKNVAAFTALCLSLISFVFPC